MCPSVANGGRTSDIEILKVIGLRHVLFLQYTDVFECSCVIKIHKLLTFKTTLNKGIYLSQCVQHFFLQSRSVSLLI